MNQDNNEEKLKQVAQMADIYGRATLVTVHLNSGINGVRSTPADFEKMITGWGINSIFRKAMSRSPRPVATGVAEVLFASDAIQAFLLIQELRWEVDALAMQKWNIGLMCERSSWKCNALTRLLQQPWFERIWVIQEVVLASSVRIMYHGREMDWDIFTEGIDAMTNSPGRTYMLEKANNPDFTPSALSQRVNCLNSIMKWRADHNQLGQKKIPFAEILQASGNFKASELRDHVFAVLGLCPESDLTEPDYNLDLEEVYLGASGRLIHEIGVPNVLSLAGIGHSAHAQDRLPKLPSWGPDWSRTCRRVGKGGPKTLGLYVDFVSQRSETAYAAGGLAETPVRTCRRDQTSLFIRTITVDVIVSLSPGIDDSLGLAGRNKPADIGHLHNRWAAAYRLVMESQFTKNPYPFGGRNEPQTLEDAFWRVLVGDRTKDQRPAPATLEKAYKT
jgi:hypothetical protein